MCESFEIAKLDKLKEEVMRCLVLKQKDVFVNLPPGFGKSMIF